MKKEMKRKLQRALTSMCALFAAAVYVLTSCGVPTNSSGMVDNEAQSLSEVTDGSGEQSNSLTISCYDTMTFKNYLETAAKEFEADNPGVTITVNTFSSMPEVKEVQQGGMTLRMMTRNEDDAQERSDYIQGVNTEIMSGKGADIFTVDAIPFYKYADKGLLEDISEYMDSDPDFNRSDYRENILDAAVYNGGMYFFPLDYSFSCFSYDSTFFNEDQQARLDSAGPCTYDQLIQAGAPVFEEVNAGAETPTKMFSMSDKQFFNQLAREYYGTFVDIENRKANFNDGQFTSLLQSVKDYAAKGYLNESMQQNQKLDVDSIQKIRDERFFFKQHDSNSLINFFNTDGNIMISSVGSTGNTEDDKLIGISSNNDGGAGFTFSHGYAINSNSKNKDLAWKFIKFLANQSMTDMISMRGLPVNNASRAEKARSMIAGVMRTATTAFQSTSDNGAKVNNSQQEGGLTQKVSPQQEGNFEQADISKQDEDPSQANNSPQEDASSKDGDSGQVYFSKQNDGSSKDSGSPQMANTQQLEVDLSKELTPEQQEALERYTEAIESYSDSINKYVITDSTITALIQSETNEFFDGTKSADEVASALQNRINLYLNE